MNNIKIDISLTVTSMHKNNHCEHFKKGKYIWIYQLHLLFVLP